MTGWFWAGVYCIHGRKMRLGTGALPVVVQLAPLVPRRGVRRAFVLPTTCRNGNFIGEDTLRAVDGREDVFDLGQMFDDGVLRDALYLPPWIQRSNGLAGMLAFPMFANKIKLDTVDADDLVLGL